MDPCQSTSHSPHEENHTPVRINNVQLSQDDDAKYLGLNLDRKLTWHKHIFAKRKQLGITLTKMWWLIGRKSTLHKQQTSHIYNTQTNLDLQNTTLGYSFHFQHRNSRTFSIESFEQE
jgi:hypothetical protein